MIDREALALCWMVSRSSANLSRLETDDRPRELWRATPRRLRRLGLGERAVDSIMALRAACPLEKLVREVEEGPLDFIADGEVDFPLALADLGSRRPAGLFLRGSRATWRQVLERPRMTIVGTRQASAHAREVARAWARDLASRGVVIVSGMARGVDSAAHEGALESGGLSIAVLGNGADVVYPPEAGRLYTRLEERGAVVSELPPGMSPARWTFPLRNRLLAALGDAVLVVEAGARSGALSTVGEAAEMGRAVFCVPGPVIGPANVGTNRLLWQGALPAVDSDLLWEDFLCHARTQMAGRFPGVPTANRTERRSGSGGDGDEPGHHGLGGPTDPGAEECSALERLIQIALGGGPLSVDEVAAAVGCSAREAASSLTALEIRGRVRREGVVAFSLR